MKEHNHALQNAYTRPCLQSRTQNICFVISISFLVWSYQSNHIHFPLIQVLKNSMTWHFLTFTSPSSKREFVHPPCCGVKGSWNPVPKLTIVLMWKTHACFKFGQTCNRAVENFLQRKLWVWAANDARSSPPNFLVSFYLSCSWRNAFW